MEKSPAAEPSGLFEILERQARAHGFPLAGAVDVTELLAEGSPFPEHVARYREWLSQGMHGEMAYLERGLERRADPRQVFPEAQSIFCVAFPHDPRAIEWSSLRVARYSRGRDYHVELKERLEATLTAAAAEWRGPAFTTKVCVDTSAVLERTIASLAGLGWIGKNTLLLHPKWGSYLLLAEAFLSVPLGRPIQPLASYCGNCERCLHACPTDAFVAPGKLDARKCISYQTLEYRGELTPSEARGIGPWVAGCDVCQEVCPFNQKIARGAEPTPATLPEPATLAALSDDEIRALFRESALSRVKPAQWRRNISAAKPGKSGLDPDAL